MARIVQGGNLFESMRIILPEHRDMMIDQRGESDMAKSSQSASTDEWRHKYLSEDDLYEAGNLLGQARHDGFLVSVTFAAKTGSRTLVGKVSDLRAASQEIVLDAHGRVIRIPVMHLMGVETASAE